MNNLSRLFITAVVLCCMSGFAQTDSARLGDTLPNRVLIAMGESYTENAVSAIVKDSLEARGYQVSIVNIKTLADQDRRLFRVVILFSAVKENSLTPAAEKFVRSQSGPGRESNMLICDILGGTWSPGGNVIDAVAAATERVNPAETAQRILSNIDNVTIKR